MFSYNIKDKFCSDIPGLCLITGVSSCNCLIFYIVRNFLGWILLSATAGRTEIRNERRRNFETSYRKRKKIHALVNITKCNFSALLEILTSG